MGSPILFARNARLTSAGPTIQLASIPQTAAHLEILVRTRYDSDTTNDQYVGLRFNGDSGANYRSTASQGSTASLTTGLGGDGYNANQLSLGHVNENQANHAGMFHNFRGMVSRYAEAIPHNLLGIGHYIFDDGNAESEYRRLLSAGYHDDASAITQIDVFNQNAADFAVGSEIQVWGLAAEGDAASIARSAGTLVLDFAGDALKDITLAAGANVFSAVNPVLGSLLQCKLTGGDGTTTITFPTGTEVLENNYVAGADAWLSIRCTNETGPEFIANLKDLV